LPKGDAVTTMLSSVFSGSVDCGSARTSALKAMEIAKTSRVWGQGRDIRILQK
jgi:hypothetical protein